jgi:hypothetical protein
LIGIPSLQELISPLTDTGGEVGTTALDVEVGDIGMIAGVGEGLDKPHPNTNIKSNTKTTIRIASQLRFIVSSFP